MELLPVLLSKVIQHKIDNHSGHADVEPDRKSPVRDGNVAFETGFQCPIQGDDRQYGDGGRKGRVCQQDREVNGAQGAGMLEAYDTSLRVVDEIANQKSNGNAKRGYHYAAVLPDAAVFD